MLLFAISSLVFLVALGLSISGLYFLIEAPASRRRLFARLEAIEQSSVKPSGGAEIDILRKEVLSRVPVIHRILIRIPWMVRLQVFMQQAAMEMKAATLLLIAFLLTLVAFLAGALVSPSLAMASLLAAAAGVAPFLVVALKRQRRFAKFEELFPDAIDLLSRAVRAGHTFTTSFELIAKEMPEPIAGEFRMTFEQQNFGMPLREALQNLAVRVPLPDVYIFLSAMQIQLESGGNLAEILDKLSYVIRERFKILRQIKVLTAEGRVSLYILAAIPPFAVALMYLVSPEYIMVLLQKPLGHKMLAATIILQIMGYAVIRRITRLRI